MRHRPSASLPDTLAGPCRPRLGPRWRGHDTLEQPGCGSRLPPATISPLPTCASDRYRSMSSSTPMTFEPVALGAAVLRRADRHHALHSSLTRNPNPRPVMVMLDEFDQLGPMPIVEQALKQLAGHGAGYRSSPSRSLVSTTSMARTSAISSDPPPA